MTDRQTTPTIRNTSTEASIDASTTSLQSPQPENQGRGTRGRRGQGRRGRGRRSQTRRGRSDRQTRSQSNPQSQQLPSEESSTTALKNDRLADAYAHVKETMPEYNEVARHEILLDMCRRIQRLEESLTETRRRITELEGHIDNRFHSSTRDMLIDILNDLNTGNLILNPSLVNESSISEDHLSHHSPQGQSGGAEGSITLGDFVAGYDPNPENELVPSVTEKEEETTYKEVHNEEEIMANRSDEQKISQVDTVMIESSDAHSDEPATMNSISKEPSTIRDNDDANDETRDSSKRPRTS